MSNGSRRRERDRAHAHRVAVASLFLEVLTVEKLGALASVTQEQVERLAPIVDRVGGAGTIVTFATYALAFIDAAERIRAGRAAGLQ
jgi:hypothetical protein